MAQEMMIGGDHNGLSTRTALVPRAASHVTPQAWACLKAAADWVPHVMQCRAPYVGSKGMAFGCGQCLPCRINKRRIWTHRIMLEAALHPENAFVTLTYNDDHLPAGGTLVPAHAKDWLKRLRFALEPQRIRFFLVGEYGDETERPHYHAAIFGIGACVDGITTYHRDGRRRCKDCYSCELVSRTWTSGNIYVGSIEPHSAAYIAGYTTKKMTAKDDERLDGRYPEFARMSLRPGIGADAMHEVASAMLTFAENAPDAVQGLRHGKSVLPLGRYLTQKLREGTGRDKKAPPETLQRIQQKLQDVQKAAELATSAPGMARFTRLVLRNLLMDKYKGRADQIEARNKLFNRKRSTL